MSLRHPDSDDLGLNMTPMIDIVFQLIVFFMLNLKFKAADERIDTNLPKEVGIDKFPIFRDAIPAIRISLFRMDPADPAAARTKIRVGGHEWVTPAGDAIEASLRPADFEAQRERVFASVEARVKDLLGTAADRGEIDAPRPLGELVPHADVVRVLDAFLGAGCKDVTFQGVRMPRPGR